MPITADQMQELLKVLERIAEALEKQTEATESLAGSVNGVNFAIQEIGGR